jgi:hypothetical protein
MQAQAFVFEFRGFKLNKFTAPINVNFMYSPLPNVLGGFGVTSGGGTWAVAAGVASIQNSSAGVTEGLPSTTAGWDSSFVGAGLTRVRAGLQGVLDP